MKVNIVCITDSDKHFASAISEYMKRMQNIVSIIKIKPIKHGTKKQIIEKESDLLEKALEAQIKKGFEIFFLSIS